MDSSHIKALGHFKRGALLVEARLEFCTGNCYVRVGLSRRLTQVWSDDGLISTIQSTGAGPQGVPTVETIMHIAESESVAVQRIQRSILGYSLTRPLILTMSFLLLEYAAVGARQFTEVALKLRISDFDKPEFIPLILTVF